jgi:hypothetical protein
MGFDARVKKTADLDRSVVERICGFVFLASLRTIDSSHEHDTIIIIA